MSYPVASRCALLTLAIVWGVAAAFGFAGSGISEARPAGAAGEDSPWPGTKALGPNVRAARRELVRLERQVELMEQSAENAEDWMTCIRYVPVNEQGDRDRQFGYLYDELDGAGLGFMDGIAVDRRRRRGREDYLFMHFRGDGCRSDSPKPGGTAEPASARAASTDERRRLGPRRRLNVLERRAERLSERSQRLETISERFDEWESCVSWVPVTELGDPDQGFGYLFGPKGSPAGVPDRTAHRPRRLGRPGLHVPRARRGRPAGRHLPGRTRRGD